MLKKRDCKWLMVSLLALILLSPIIVVWGKPGRVVMGVLLTFVLFSGIGVVSDSKRHLLWGVVLIAPAFVMQWVSQTLQLGQERIWLVPSFYSFPIFILLGYLLVQHLFRAGRITLDHLYGAISLYLLIGLIWTHAYIVVEHLHPDSFNFARTTPTDPSGFFVEFLYYSYVTLTTLGYGDVTPATALARSLSILEAICGVLFMGAFVARIAGSFEWNREEEESP